MRRVGKPDVTCFKRETTNYVLYITFELFIVCISCQHEEERDWLFGVNSARIFLAPVPSLLANFCHFIMTVFRSPLSFLCHQTVFFHCFFRKKKFDPLCPLISLFISLIVWLSSYCVERRSSFVLRPLFMSLIWPLHSRIEIFYCFHHDIVFFCFLSTCLMCPSW